MKVKPILQTFVSSICRKVWKVKPTPKIDWPAYPTTYLQLSTYLQPMYLPPNYLLLTWHPFASLAHTN